MKFDKQIKAKELRSQGKSINFIAKELAVSKGSVSAWVRNILLTDEQKNNLTETKNQAFIEKFIVVKKQQALNLRINYQEEGKIKAQEKDFLHCMGCMLFWAEGSKDKNAVIFTNSDVYMMKIFVQFLKTNFGIKNSDISLHINCYLKPTENIQDIQNYWIQQLRIEGCRLIKPAIKLNKEDISNYGICRITVCNTHIAQHLYGAIQAYANFDTGFCLENKRTRTS